MIKRGWAKIVQPLKSYKNKYMTQWLIGIFVHFISSKDDLINCAGVGIRTLLISQSSFPLPFLLRKNTN